MSKVIPPKLLSSPYICYYTFLIGIFSLLSCTSFATVLIGCNLICTLSILNLSVPGFGLMAIQRLVLLCGKPHQDNRSKCIKAIVKIVVSWICSLTNSRLDSLWNAYCSRKEEEKQRWEWMTVSERWGRISFKNFFLHHFVSLSSYNWNIHWNSVRNASTSEELLSTHKLLLL